MCPWCCQQKKKSTPQAVPKTPPKAEMLTLRCGISIGAQKWMVVFFRMNSSNFFKFAGISGTGDLKKQKKTRQFWGCAFCVGGPRKPGEEENSVTKPNLYGNLIGISKSGTLEF